MALASEDGLLATEDGFLTSIPRDPDPGLGPNPDPIPIPRDWGNPDPVRTLLAGFRFRPFIDFVNEIRRLLNLEFKASPQLSNFHF